MKAVDYEMVLREKAQKEKVKILSGFHKKGKGGYAEHIQFLGVPIPEIRKVIQLLPLPDEAILSEMMQSQIHEMRLLGWLTLVHLYEKGGERNRWFEFYQKMAHHAAGWDLVDLCAPKILGAEAVDHPELSELFISWADDECLWKQRAAMVATWTLLKAGQDKLTLLLAEKLVYHPHDLMHKAVGWMLRESAKRVSKPRVVDFLLKYKSTMSRTALRYAIEHFSQEERRLMMEK